MNQRWLVAQPFQTTGSAGFPARHSIGRLESRPNPQVEKPALRFGSWRASTVLRPGIGTIEPRRIPLTRPSGTLSPSGVRVRADDPLDCIDTAKLCACQISCDRLSEDSTQHPYEPHIAQRSFHPDR